MCEAKLLHQSRFLFVIILQEISLIPLFICVAVAAEPGHGGVPDFYKNYYPGYNGANRAPTLHTTEEKSSRRLVGLLV